MRMAAKMYFRPKGRAQPVMPAARTASLLPRMMDQTVSGGAEKLYS